MFLNRRKIFNVYILRSYLFILQILSFVYTPWNLRHFQVYNKFHVFQKISETSIHLKIIYNFLHVFLLVFLPHQFLTLYKFIHFSIDEHFCCCYVFALGVMNTYVSLGIIWWWCVRLVFPGQIWSFTYGTLTGECVKNNPCKKLEEAGLGRERS